MLCLNCSICKKKGNRGGKCKAALNAGCGLVPQLTLTNLSSVPQAAPQLDKFTYLVLNRLPGSASFLSDCGIILGAVFFFHGFAALAANGGVKLRPSFGLYGIPALAPDRDVELASALFSDSLAAFAADFGVELRSILLLDLFSALLAGLPDGHLFLGLVIFCHLSLLKICGTAHFEVM